MPSESGRACGPQELQQLLVCDRSRRGTDARSELLEEYPQALIVEKSRRLDDPGYLYFMPGLHDPGNGLRKIRRQMIHQGRV
jgi:hypothetical protein